MRLAAICAILASGAALGQTRPAFFDDWSGAVSLSFSNNTIQARGEPMTELVRQTFHISRAQVVGPAWLADVRATFTQRLPSGATRRDVSGYLLGVLVRYYKLQVHREKRILDVSVLRIAPGGPHLHEAPSSDRRDPNCEPEGKSLVCRNLSSFDLAWRLTYPWRFFDTGPVADETGLTGKYNFKLGSDAQDVDELLKPLGLEIDKRKQEVEVLVVDHCEKSPAPETSSAAPAGAAPQAKLTSRFPIEFRPGPEVLPALRSDAHFDLRAEATLVTVPVSVTDAKERPVIGLKKEDFTVLDNGDEQHVLSVSREDAPIALCVVYDMSGSVGGNNRKGWAMVREVLKHTHPGDELCIVTVATDADVAIPMTRDESSEEVDRKLLNLKGGGATALLDGV